MSMIAADSQKVQDYASKVSNIIYDTANYETEVLFYLTQHCNLVCDGCYMQAGPDVPRNTLPVSDLSFYLSEFDKVPNFTHGVVFSGGEVFSAPINYVEAAAHNVLDRGWQLQFKTNGSWVQNPQKRDAVVAMLGRLQPHRGLCATEDEVLQFLRRIPKPIARVLGPKILEMWMYHKLPTTSMLDMAVSVDDLLHPAKSAQWFVDIAELITSNRRLRNKVNLKTFTLNESAGFFENYVLGNPQLGATNVVRAKNKNALRYDINGCRAEAYFGDYVDVGKVSPVDKLSNIVMPSLGDSAGRLVYCFYPDKTVGFDCYYLESVGRVPYVDGQGRRKSFARLQRDMYTQLVLDYARAISK